MTFRPQPVLLDVKTETLVEEAVHSVATFFEQLLRTPANDWSLPSWLQSRKSLQSLQQADRIIDALL